MSRIKKELFSLEVERTCLSSLLQNPELIPDYASFIKPNMYSSRYHESICSIMYAMFQEKSFLDKTLLVERLKNIGLSKINDLSIFDYIDTFSLIPINPEHIKDYFAELYKYYWARQQEKALSDAYYEIHSNLDKPLNEIVPRVEKVIADAATVVVADDYKPLDIFGSMEDYLEDRANNQRQIGLITPYSIFNKKYAGLPFGDLYVISAAAKMGKSTFLGYTAYGCAKIKLNNCKVAYFDTELEGERVLTRLASSLSGVNEYFLKTGKFKDNKSYYNKIKTEVYPEAAEMAGKITHFYVANEKIDSVLAKFKRWYFTNVKSGENVLLVYDYLKIGDNQVSDHRKEYAILGEITDKIKKCVSAYPRTAGLVAAQLNRANEVGLSSQIEAFASNIYRLMPKSLMEIQNHGKKFGTHKLEPLRTRIQGEEADGFDFSVEVIEDGEAKTIPNYINFNIEQFKVSECGMLSDVISNNAGQILSDKVYDDEDGDVKHYNLEKKTASSVLF